MSVDFPCGVHAVRLTTVAGWRVQAELTMRSNFAASLATMSASHYILGIGFPPALLPRLPLNHCLCSAQGQR
eukprot:3793142-Rhodomonas_salina.3